MKTLDDLIKALERNTEALEELIVLLSGAGALTTTSQPERKRGYGPELSVIPGLADWPDDLESLGPYEPEGA